MITIKDVCNTFNVQRAAVKQQGSKQLFIVIIDDVRYLVSYLTIVGRYDSTTETWLITTKRYSVTTTRQINMFIASNKKAIRVAGCYGLPYI